MFAFRCALFVGLVCLISAVSARADGTADRSLNVVLFLVDDMGWMDCGAYGSQYYETPNIDALARRGMLFTDAYSAHPLCSPTRASILTGKYPARLGLTTAAGHRPPRPSGAPRYPEKASPRAPIITPESVRYLDPAEVTLAEQLRDAGYRTGHFGKWHLGLTEPYWPERQGFDVAWHGKPDPGPRSYFSPYQFKAGTVTDGPDGEYIVDRVTDEALAFIEGNKDRPFYVNLWQYGVHGPWQAKPALIEKYKDRTDPRGKQNNPVMAAMLKSVDESLGRVVAKLEELGLTERTLILFSSDNGGNVHSADRTPNHLPPTNNAPLRKGKAWLYEGGIRVPLIVVLPGVVPAGTRTSEMVSTIDFAPTILDVLDHAVKEAYGFDGISFASVLREPDSKLPRKALFNFFPHGGPSRPPGVTVRRGKWKLIRYYQTGPEYPALRELYNLETDLGETKNVAKKHPEKVVELDALIDGFLSDTQALVPKRNPNYNAEAAALEGWVARFCETKVAGGVLTVTGTGRRPFIAAVRFRAPGPAEVRLRVRSEKGGPGRIQWRTAAQEEFPKQGQTVPYKISPNKWQELTVKLPAKGVVRHVRVFLPANDSAVDVDWIEMHAARGKRTVRVQRWDFGGPRE